MDILKSFISLLALINPVGAIPFFMSLTALQSDAERRRTIRIAAISVFCVIAVTTLLGQQIISFFGISVGSLEVGGGIIMLLMAINMLNAQIGNSRSTPEERHEAEQKDNIAVVPLAIPLLTGPGAISTTIIYAAGSAHWYDRLSLSRSARCWRRSAFFRCASPNRLPAGSVARVSTSVRGSWV